MMIILGIYYNYFFVGKPIYEFCIWVDRKNNNMFETQFSSGIHPFIFYEKCIIRRMLDSALDWMAMISKSTVNEESDEDVSIQEWEENSFSFLLLLYGLMIWCLHHIHIIIYPTVWSWKEMNEGYYIPTVVVSLCMCAYMPCVFLPQIHLISWKSKMSSILCPGCDDDVDCGSCWWP